MIHFRLLFCTILLGLSVSACDTKTKTVAISQFISHKALDKTYQGIIDKLNESGFQKGKNLNIVYENAHGNNLTAAQIGTKFSSLKPDVMVGIATPAAQALVRVSKNGKVPLLFGAVSDPAGAGLQNARGVSDAIPLAPLVKRIREIFPTATKVGVIYSAGEANSIAQVRNFTTHAEKEGFSVLEKSILRSTDAQAAFDVLARQVDIVFTPTDNLIISATNLLIQRSFTHNTPIISSNHEPVERGALMAFGVDYYAQGKMIGDQIVSLLKGDKRIEDLKIMTQEKIDFIVNKKTADTMGIIMSEAVLSEAKKVY